MVMLAASALFIFVHDLITQCDYFQAKAVTVIGAKQLTAGEILEQAQMKEGENILSVNLSLMRRRLLTHPWIAEAEVKRELPDKIVITIRENEPLALIDLGKRFLINEYGEIFKEWETSDPVDLPVICGLDFSDISIPGTSRGMSYDAVISILMIGRGNKDMIPNHFIRQIIVDPEVGVTMCAFDDRKTIRMGYHDYPEKFERLQGILFFLGPMEHFEDFDFVDLMEPDRIVVGPVRLEHASGDKKEV